MWFNNGKLTVKYVDVVGNDGVLYSSVFGSSDFHPRYAWAFHSLHASQIWSLGSWQGHSGAAIHSCQSVSFSCWNLAITFDVALADRCCVQNCQPSPKKIGVPLQIPWDAHGCEASAFYQNDSMMLWGMLSGSKVRATHGHIYAISYLPSFALNSEIIYYILGSTWMFSPVRPGLARSTKYIQVLQWFCLLWMARKDGLRWFEYVYIHKDRSPHLVVTSTCLYPENICAFSGKVRGSATLTFF